MDGLIAVAVLSHCMQSTVRPVVKTLVSYICEMLERCMFHMFLFLLVLRATLDEMLIFSSCL